LDGSPKAERALALLPLLGRRYPIEATVARVVEAASEDQTVQLRSAQSYLNRIAAEHSNEKIRIETAVGTGPLVDAILTIARQRRATLLVMSMIGDRTAGSGSLGSDLRGLIDRSPIPLILPPPLHPVAPERLERSSGLMVAVADAKESPDGLVPPAAALAEILGLDVLLLEVVPVEATGRREAEARATAEDHLAPFRRGLEERGIVVEPIVEPGDPAGTILRVAEDSEASLIALGAPSLVPRSSQATPSLSERMLLLATIPVLITPGATAVKAQAG
jgi:nucleotide-binding universal stress UspA family protein